jgi:2-polyprenyl-6-methoxyphenol hydroxylase-like FAD-dependent oxidoreductase
VSTEVAIIGAGPTGIVLSILLAQRGHSVMLLEKQASPYPLPRAVAVDAEIARVLQACGIAAGFRQNSEPAETYEWRSASGQTLLKFVGKGDGPSGWPQTSMVNQPQLERMLTERLDALTSISVQRGCEVTSVEDHGDSVTLRYSREAGGTHEVTARYAIACDGANSPTRTMLGIPVEDLGFFYDWLVVDVIPHQQRVYDPINLQVCDPLRPTTVVSGGPGRRRWEFMRLPDEDPAELSGAESAWRLLEPWDIHPGNATLERSANYTFRARWAEQWRAGRVLLAGDAAHQMPPFAGQGMCSGIRDAANLAWKLDLALRGCASDALLDHYGVERMPNVKAIINFSIELGKVICIPDSEAAAARDDEMAAALARGEPASTPPLPGIERGVVDRSTPLAGGVSIQGTLDIDGPVPADDVTGTGFVLVSSAPVSANVDPSLLEWFGSIGGTVVDLALGTPGPDVGGRYGRWLSRHGVVAVLQRPDFYVYGSAASANSIEELLTGLRDHLR